MHSEGKGATGWVVGGTGWYRKSFATPELPQGGRAILLFDGVYRNSEMWVNGKEVGRHAYGYSPFYFDVTSYLNERGANVLAMKVNNNGKNSRWYSGSGIDRHVSLITTGRVSIPVWGVHVQPSKISTASATVTVDVQLINHDSAAATATVACKLVDEQGRTAATAQLDKRLAANESGEVQLIAQMTQPQLWSPASPNRYTAEVEVSIAGRVADRTTAPFGIRTIEVDAEKGLRINGDPIQAEGRVRPPRQWPSGFRSYRSRRGAPRRIAKSKWI